MSQLLSLILPATIAAALAFALAPLASRFAVRIGAVDSPGDRKIHATAIPRLGGLAVVASISLVMAGIPMLSGGRWELPLHLVTPLALGVLPVFVVSLLDDISHVGARKKFLAHTLGASIAVASGISLAPVVHLFGSPIYIGVFAIPLSILWIVGVTNAFNLIDGLDGLSAGLALISAVSMAAVFMLLGELQMGGVVLVLAGALVGFLPYNVHPARMFLGDSGATAIGFCLAVFALRGGSTLTSGFAALLPVFMLGLPIADTLITLTRRLVNRFEGTAAGVFVPDRNHIHHRLLALGVHHKTAVLILYGAGLLMASAAFASVFMNAREAGLFVVALLFAGVVGVQRLGYAEFAFIRRGKVLKVYELPVVKRGMFVVFVDIFLAIVAAYIAVGLKSDQWNWPLVRKPLLDLATTFAPVTVLLFWASGMYRGSWRVAGLRDLANVATAVLSVTVTGGLLVSLFSGAQYPLSLFIIYGVVSLLLGASSRASYVVLESTRLRANHQGAPVLIYGAGNRGVAAASELFRNTSAGLRPIGFIDDDARKQGRVVSGLPVLGTEQDLEALSCSHAIRAVLIAAESIPENRIAQTLDVCQRVGISVFRFNVHIAPVITAIGAGPAGLVYPVAAAEPSSTAAVPVTDTFVPSTRRKQA
jgi:UDP-GlcNAc:undecaprenyl-phosphate GlcNAc-1-phosphate transferase